MIAEVFSLLGALALLISAIGLVRFKDTFVAMHALTKADILAVGLIVLSAVFNAGNLSDILKLLILFVAIAIFSAFVSYAIASRLIKV
ncbi:MAG: monovalent cation/H(+) antiporter subunit G [Aquificaceae bacterium]|nr:monovalent cation/H(+) antiporter subunit G [Aquificaceae bacterium]